MSWEQEITAELQAVENVPVRFDVVQDRSATDKARARANAGVVVTAENISGTDYKIIIP